MKILPLLLLLLPLTAHADLSHDLGHFFNQLGLSTNTTAPQAYQDQQAGYYTGGSLFARAPVRRTQIARITLPHIRAGCGGIDLFTGGFSFIKSEELIHAFKNIMSNVPGYAFSLALETVTPQIANLMHRFQAMANKVNQMNLNSCENAAALVGSIWPKTQIAQRQTCAIIGTHAGVGLFDDWAAARQGCGAGGQAAKVLKRGAKNPATQAITPEGNLIWRALKQHPWLATDTAMAAWLMSLSGTVVIETHSNQPYRSYPSLLSETGWVKALLYGGTLTRYQCDNDLCYHPTKIKTTLDTSQGFVSQVRQQLHSIRAHIQADTPLSPAEQGLLQSTPLPLYKLLNVTAAYHQNKDIFALDRYAEVIALEILIQYLDENLQLIQQTLASQSYPPSSLKPFYSGLTHARERLHRLNPISGHRLWLRQQMIHESRIMEQSLYDQMAHQLVDRP
jgi:conjugative transfer pilus assembly protein TraH